MLENRRISKRITLFVLITAAALLVNPATSSIAAEKENKKELPPRAISVAPEYTGVLAAEGEDLSVDLIVANRGRRDEDIDLQVTSVPQGWKAWIKTYSFGVTGVHLESDKTKTLTLKLEPEEQVGPGRYAFQIRAQTGDGGLSESTKLVVTVEAEKKKKKTKGVNITTSYPVLRGPTDAEFEFSVEVENELDKDTIFNLSARAPEGWETNFKPAYEDKFFSSLRIKANQSQTMAVSVKPHPGAEPGEYPVEIKVSSAEAEGKASLMVALSGTHKMEMGTASGLLSLDAVRGKEANLSFFVRNSGSAALNNIEFLSLKSENWKVEFSPEAIPALAPEELKQVDVSITPAEQALVGDYSVGLNAKTGRLSKHIELRVTVKASTAWGWIGIGIILLVIAGLVTLFIRLGRR
jgi:uncharacterized membrane protein